MSAHLDGQTAVRRSLDVALWCARRDWPVAPLAPLSKRPAPNCPACKPLSDDRPAHPPQQCPCIAGGGWCHAFHAATLDSERVEKWWTHNPDFGVSIATGPARLLVLDIDRHATEVPDRGRLLPGINIPAAVNLTGLSNGFHTLALLAALRQQQSPADDQTTLRVATPQDGMHVYYRLLPHHPELRSSVGTSGTVALAWQVDVKASRSAIVAPGTVTRNGTYRRVGSTRMPSPAPSWLIAELGRTGHTSRRRLVESLPAAIRRPPQPRGQVPAAARIEPLLEAIRGCASTPAGAAFTEKLNRAAFTAGGFVAQGCIGREEAVALLIGAARQARPEHRQITAIINSGLQAGAQRPIQD